MNTDDCQPDACTTNHIQLVCGVSLEAPEGEYSIEG